jgi:hypothetical protein
MAAFDIMAWFISLLPPWYASGLSPYEFTIGVINDVFWPRVPPYFEAALWIACGLFSLCVFRRILFLAVSG